MVLIFDNGVLPIPPIQSKTQNQVSKLHLLELIIYTKKLTKIS